MRFMMFMIPGVYQSEGGPEGKPLEDFQPDAEAVKTMMRFNAELAQAGVLVSLDGLHPSSKGARVRFAGKKPSVTDGPFSESKEVIGGYWILDVKSREDAIEWAKRCPAAEDDIIEIRQIFEMVDFPADVQHLADNLGVRAQIEKQRS